MTDTEDNSNWQLALGSLDIDLEEDDALDYSKLLKRESNSEPATDVPRRRELRRPLARLLVRRHG